MKDKEINGIKTSDKTSMVDVGMKEVTRRTAMAECYIHFPPELFSSLRESQFLTHKGSIISTSTVAGLMGVKKTPDILPLCHPISVSGTDIDIEPAEGENKIRIQCTVKCDGKTGVEMEALTGVSVAALCIYDMCKAFSQDLTITDLRLCYKRGGKSDYGK